MIECKGMYETISLSQSLYSVSCSVNPTVLHSNIEYVSRDGFFEHYFEATRLRADLGSMI